MKVKSLQLSPAETCLLQDFLTASIQPKEYEPCSGKKLIEIYKQVYGRVFVRKVNSFLFRDDKVKDIFQKLSKILAANEINPEAYITAQMTILHDYVVSKSIKFNPNMLVSDKALDRYWESVDNVQCHGHTTSADAIESIAGFQELYDDLYVSEYQFGSDFVSVNMTHKEFNLGFFVSDNIEFLGENWLVHFRDVLSLEDYIEQFSEDRLELIDSILEYKDSESYGSNLMSNLARARASATIGIIHQWSPFLEDTLKIEKEAMTLEPLLYWQYIYDFIPENNKPKVSEMKKVLKELGQRWGSHLES